MGKQWKQSQILSSWAPKSLQVVTTAMKTIASLEKPKTRQRIKKQRHHFASKGLYSRSYGFSSSHVWMLELDHQEGWAPKNWCFWTVVLEKTLRVHWAAKRPNQSILKEINLKYSLEGLMLKLMLPYLGHLMWRADLLEKTLMLGKIEGEGDED